jgi:hypothetical protein
VLGANLFGTNKMKTKWAEQKKWLRITFSSKVVLKFFWLYRNEKRSIFSTWRHFL